MSLARVLFDNLIVEKVQSVNGVSESLVKCVFTRREKHWLPVFPEGMCQIHLLEGCIFFIKTTTATTLRSFYVYTQVGSECQVNGAIS